MAPQLRSYQQEALAFLHQHDRAGLFLAMGLGKTATVLASLRPQDLPALVVAPKRVAEATWPQEIEIWRPDLFLVSAAGTPVRRTAALQNDLADVVSLGRDVLAQSLPALLARQKGKDPFRTLILDESSSFKSHTSQRTKAAIKLSPHFQRVVALTGTPSPLGYLDLWPQLRILDGGERLGKKLSAYRDRYFTPDWPLPNGVIPGYSLKPGADKRIREKIEDICLYMGTEGRVDLPDLVFNQVQVPLPAKVRKVYRAMEADLVADLTDENGEVHTAQNAAVMTSKLRQITAGAMYVDDAEFRDDGAKLTQLHREKFAAAQEVIDGTGSPVLVFYQYRFERDWLLGLPGARDINEKGVIAAWNAGRVPLLVAHPQSAGHGLNLQHGGHTVLWTTPTWSLEEWLQGNKRLHRSGQQHPVVVHTLVSPGTIDEAVVQRLEGRKTVQQALLDYLDSNNRK